MARGVATSSSPNAVTFTATMAVVLVVLTLLPVTVNCVPPGTDHGILSIKNNLPFAMTINCASNIETHPAFYATPGKSLQFDFEVHQHYSWTCGFQSEGPDGSYVLWKSEAAGGPGNLCRASCQWRAETEGLKLMRADGKTVLVYPWHYFLN